MPLGVEVSTQVFGTCSRGSNPLEATRKLVVCLLFIMI